MLRRGSGIIKFSLFGNRMLTTLPGRNVFSAVSRERREALATGRKVGSDQACVIPDGGKEERWVVWRGMRSRI